MGVSRDCQNFFGYPLLSQERVKLRTSNLVGTLTGPIRIKALKNFLEKKERGRIQGLPKFLLLAVAKSFYSSYARPKLLCLSM